MGPKCRPPNPRGWNRADVNPMTSAHKFHHRHSITVMEKYGLSKFAKMFSIWFHIALARVSKKYFTSSDPHHGISSHIILTYYLTFYLTSILIFNLAYLPVFILYIFWRSIWHIFWHLCGILSRIYFGILCGILCGIYSGSLSDIYSGNFSGIYSGIPSGR